jgi:membrane-bound metal-dependent hydrolase YbcI (DUF457 family)
LATPLGHTLFGVALARRLNVRSPFGTAAAVVAASLPDIDVIAGLLLHRDPWKLHRQATHTFGFALAAGAAAGAAGILSAGNADGHRDLVADALTGAILVGSHVALDRAPVPYLPTPPDGMDSKTYRRNNIANWCIDAVLYGAIAWRIWPRRRDTSAHPR